MGILVKETLNNLMQLATEEIALGKDCLDTICVWAEMSEEYGEI